MSRFRADPVGGRRRSVIAEALFFGLGLPALVVLACSVHWRFVALPAQERHDAEIERYNEETRKMRQREEERTRKIIEDLDKSN